MDSLETLEQVRGRLIDAGADIGENAIVGRLGVVGGAIEVSRWPRFSYVAANRQATWRRDSPAAADHPPPAAPLQPGTTLIGSGAPAGRYIARNAVSGYYWERLSGLGGTTDDIIANDFQGFDGRIMVDIAATDHAFRFDADCGTFASFTDKRRRGRGVVPTLHQTGGPRSLLSSRSGRRGGRRPTSSIACAAGTIPSDAPVADEFVNLSSAGRDRPIGHRAGRSRFRRRCD